MAFNFGGFGAAAQPAAQPAFGFGAPQPAAAAAPFGFAAPQAQAPQQQQPAAGFGGFGGFGAAPQAAAAPALGGFGGFAAPQQQQPAAGGFGFGAQQQAPQQAGGFGGFGVTPARPAATGFGGFGQQPAAQGWAAPQQQQQQQAGQAPAYDQPDSRLELPAANLSASTDPSYSSIDFSPTSQFITAGAWDNKCRVWELQRDASGRFVPNAFRAEVDMGAPLLDVKWSPWEPTKVYAVGCNKMLKAWDVTTNQCLDICQPCPSLHTEPIACVHLTMMGQGGSTPTIITAGWDKTLNFWDARQPGPALTSVALPERVFCMDVRGTDMVLCTAPEQTPQGMASRVHIFDLRNHASPQRSIPSPLKYQSRTVRIFADNQLYALGSIEGRCRINALRAADDEARQVGDTHPQGPRPLAFAFRCHRDGKLVYPVNAMDCFPSPDPLRSPVFATAGSDGIVSLWNRRERQKVKDVSVDPSGSLPGPEQQTIKLRTPVTDVKFNNDGSLLAYSVSYDWSRGPENYDKSQPPYIYLKNLNADYLTVKK